MVLILKTISDYFATFSTCNESTQKTTLHFINISLSLNVDLDLLGSQDRIFDLNDKHTSDFAPFRSYRNQLNYFFKFSTLYKDFATKTEQTSILIIKLSTFFTMSNTKVLTSIRIVIVEYLP